MLGTAYIPKESGFFQRGREGTRKAREGRKSGEGRDSRYKIFQLVDFQII